MGASDRKRGFLAVALFASGVGLLAACNIVAGLNKFEDQPDCVGLACVPDAGGSLDASDVDAGSVSEGGRADAPTPIVIDVRRLWARWNVSDVDASADAVLYAFDDAGAVVSRVTAMAWEHQAKAAPSLEEATGHCAAMGMQVPSRIELSTLLDFQRPGAGLVDAIFTIDAGADASLDAGPSAPLGTRYWALNGYAVDFATGATTHGAGNLVRCVRLEPTFPVSR